MSTTSIVVVPRETHSAWVPMLETLRTHTGDDVPVVVVDGGSPPKVQRELERLARAHDFTLIRSDALLWSNEARNLGRARVDTELVVFIDNDTEVAPGWLDGLERCARETGAAAVSPVVLDQLLGGWEIHSAGGVAHLEGEGAQRRFHEVIAHLNGPVTELDELERQETECIELHCLLVRAGALDEVGGFDEGLPAGREHSDLSLRLQAAGHRIVLEPEVVVRYPSVRIADVHDHFFYVPRWSEQWAWAAFRHFNEKWELRDTTLDDWYIPGTRNRRLRARPRPAGPSWRRWVWRQRRRARRAVDLVETPLLVRYQTLRRERAAPPRVVHRASWDMRAA
jgi:GT2 family glycosyltransferase